MTEAETYAFTAHVNETGDALNEYLLDIHDASKDSYALVDIQNILVDNGGNCDSKICRVAVESISRRLGVSTTGMKISAESVGSLIETVWEAIKKAFNFIWEKIKAFIKGVANYLFSGKNFYSKKKDALLESELAFTLTSNSGSNYIVSGIDNPGIATEAVVENEVPQIEYVGPDPSLLLGEHINTLTVGTSIINYNNAISAFLNESRYLFRDIRNSMIAEGNHSTYEKTYALINDKVPAHIAKHFGLRTDNLCNKLGIQPKLYYNKEILVTPVKIDRMELLKISHKQFQQPDINRQIKVNINGLRAADEMRCTVENSLKNQIKVFEEDLAVMFSITNATCDAVIRNNRYSSDELLHVHMHNRLRAIKETLEYLVDFVSSRIFSAIRQSINFSSDITHLYNFCYKILQHTKALKTA